ncbi:MAG: phosphoribosylanthranilate isomerase [Desulfuromonas sp.]|nr:phosphoribosylanthranilate isomerase [Desulfuromonas sp.]
MVRVKICGITSLVDAQQAVAAGADALGFVFYPPSPRAIEPELAAEIISCLPPFVASVGLFVNEDPARIAQIVQSCQLDVVQLHGDELPEHCDYSGVKVIKALRVRDEQCLDNAEGYPVDALLIDAWDKDVYGGTGKLGRWDLARQAAARSVVVLAGGLNPENVAEAVREVTPFAVDVSSGVEHAPGKKDPLRMRAFVKNAKQARS